MKKLLAVLFLSSMTGTSIAMPEIPFCPAGGPPGWFNHFNYKRDQNIWQRQMAYNNMLQRQARPSLAPKGLAPNRLAPNKPVKPAIQQKNRSQVHHQPPVNNTITRPLNTPHSSYNKSGPRYIQPRYAQPQYRFMPSQNPIRRAYPQYSPQHGTQLGQNHGRQYNQQNRQRYYRPAPSNRYHWQHPERRNLPARSLQNKARTNAP